MSKKVYIETVGCQMNVLDSELVMASLRKAGYGLADSPRDADVILFNTCSVRQHAEDKIYSALGRLKILKQRHPNKIIGVLGCMAQKDQKQIFQRAKHVDLIVGPGQLFQIAALLQQIEADGRPRMEVSLGRRDGSRIRIARSHESFDPLRDPEMRPVRCQAYVRIMIGCDKFCTYCIVPSVRGPEQSRPRRDILAEVRQLADEGCKEVILLGQTVNSYRYVEGDTSWRLSDLLEAIDATNGIQRIKFVSNHPSDMTDDLMDAVRDLPKCARYLHIPAQHGSNAVLRRMKRGYTIEEYRAMHARAIESIPGLAVTSDFIVGFCGETVLEFQATCDLVRDLRFKNSFIFKYSERPNTKSAELYIDDVPNAVKRRRNNELLAIQNAISESDNQPFIGRDVEILVEGPSKVAAQQNDASQISQLTGRTRCDRIVVFPGGREHIGQILPIRIDDVNAFTLFGHLTSPYAEPEMLPLRT
ncbi:MAG: tRNA (N6-isopentenyl adenosine(37)-C2)-methylthiotransferase MiaB [Pirellulales bacterium]|nr:tRNA (N6-isopentenyl adenosine(37)-C2)-methylthiotransferase MiaB [Pirellulales bacterium]